MFHKIKNVTIISNFKLCIQFDEGVVKEYDVKPLFRKLDMFRQIKDNPEDFASVSVDVRGYGIMVLFGMTIWIYRVMNYGKMGLR